MFIKNGNKGVGIKKHRYNTRNKNTPNTFPHSSELLNKSFLCRGLSAFQKLQDGTKNAKHLNILVCYYKHQIFT